MGPSLFDCRYLVFSLAVMLLGADSVLAQRKIDHLLKACAHLEQAGLPEMASEIREVSRQREWQETLGTVKLLQRMRSQQIRANRGARIGLRLKVLEFSPKKLREMGFSLVSIQLLLDNDAPTSMVDDTGSLGRLIEFLQEQKLIELTCEPALVTVAGSPVTISLDSPGVDGQDDFGIAFKQAPGRSGRGIRFDCVPHVTEGGKLDLELRFCQTDGESTKPSVVDKGKGTECEASMKIEARVEIKSGQRVILCGRRPQEKPVEDMAVLVLITAELAGSPRVPSGS